jgi:2-polyprenyl-3-methyl-5-hydroxy-6-metoxy-1,4-benzoquinol methylase
MAESSSRDVDVEALNDRIAREFSIDDYYARSPWPIRLIERRRFAIIREFLGDVDGLELAEIGSGGGHVLLMFPRARLTAIDVSGAYLEIARKNLASYDVRFLKGEVDKMQLPAKTFDRIICSEVLEHVLDPNAVLGAIARLLKPSGVAAITVPNEPMIRRIKKLVQRAPVRWIVGETVEWGGATSHRHAWRPKEFEALLADHLHVTDRRAAPFRPLPIRACFRCVSKAHTRTES